MDLFIVIIGVGIGALAGLCAGLLGIGGGIIITPLLLLVFEMQGFEASAAAIGALTTSLAAILFTSLSSTVVHARHQAVDWGIVIWLSPVAFVSAACGAQLAQFIHPVALIALLAIFLFQSCWYILRTAPPTRQFPHQIGRVTSAGIGSVAGLAGSLTGTGGGIIVSSMLVRRGLTLIKGIGTSSCNTFIVALGATLSYVGTGIVPDLFILVALVPSCLAMASLGALLANRMPLRILRFVYALAMMVVGLRLCFWIWVQLTA